MADDWTVRAARVIHLQFDLDGIAPQDTSVPRLAAIIAAHAEPLVKLLRESKREHHHGYNDEACDYPPCPLSYDDARPPERCTCGAEAWNARVEAALK